MKYLMILWCSLLSYTNLKAQVDSINLTSFVGVAVKEGIDLTWRTEGEYNARQFKLERSLDAINFEEVGIWNCTNSNIEQRYEHKEIGVYRSVVYYRLKKVFDNSAEQYSNTIAVSRNDIDDLPAISIYPTIVKSQITVIKRSDEDLTNAQIRVFDMNGRMMYIQQIENDFVNLQIDVEDYAMGAYVIEIRKGQLASKEKFVKQ